MCHILKNFYRFCSCQLPVRKSPPQHGFGLALSYLAASLTQIWWAQYALFFGGRGWCCGCFWIRRSKTTLTLKSQFSLLTATLFGFTCHFWEFADWLRQFLSVDWWSLFFLSPICLKITWFIKEKLSVDRNQCPLRWMDCINRQNVTDNWASLVCHVSKIWHFQSVFVWRRKRIARVVQVLSC